MKTITYHYKEGISWIDVVAKARGGIVDGNFIRSDTETHKGTHFVLPIEKGITAMLVDMVYKEDVFLKYCDGGSDFIGMYFYLTDLDVGYVLDEEATLIGRLDHNFSIVDSSIDMDYSIKKGTRMFVVCIFIDKKFIKSYVEKIEGIASLLKDVFDVDKNTIIRLDRMSSESLSLINDFKKLSCSNLASYEVYFKGLVFGLIGSYLKKLNAKKIVIGKVFSEDVRKIIESKAMMLEIIELPFPGVNLLAEQVFMSSSKYKQLFAKIAGMNPGAFFYSNKLYRAKELLETKKFTVNEVAVKLNYANASYFAKCFNEMFGVSPKEYQNLF